MPRRKSRLPKGFGSIHYRKERGTYEARIDLGKTAEGKRQKITRIFESSEEAEEWLAEMRPLKRSGRGSKLNQTMLELTQDFLAFKKISLDAKTFDLYSYHLNAFVIPYLGTLRLRDFNVDVAKNWLITLKSKTTDGQIHNAKRHFSMLLNDLERSVSVFKNPLRRITFTKPRRKKQTRWTRDEVIRVLEHCQKTNHVLYPYVHIALTTGMRREELLGLRWKDISFKESYLSVVQTCTYISGVYHLKLKGKTEDSERTVFVDPETLQMFQRQLERVETLRQRKTWLEHDLVFPSIVGTPVSDRWIRDTFYQLCNDAEVTRIPITDLRATYVAMSDGKVPDKVAAERSGHSEKVRREIYLRTVRDEHKEAALSIGQLTQK